MKNKLLLLLFTLGVTYSSFSQTITEDGTDAETWTVNDGNSYTNNVELTLKQLGASFNQYDWIIRNRRISNTNFNLDFIQAIDGGTKMSLTTNGRLGIGTTTPKRTLDLTATGQLTFGDGVVTNSTAGLYWYSGDKYGIYRTSGSWSSPDYQQLKIKWNTGIILDPGNYQYGKSYVDVVGGLHSESLNVGTDNSIAGAIAHFDGRVYISEENGSEEGFGAGYGSAAEYQDYLLWVEEGIVSKDFALAELTDWPDYVFNNGYDLKSLNQVESFIKANGHLPTMPAASEVETRGFTVSDMTKRMVQTIEELTLHSIEQEKQITEQRRKNAAQKKQLDSQQELIDQLLRRLNVIEKKINN